MTLEMFFRPLVPSSLKSARSTHSCIDRSAAEDCKMSLHSAAQIEQDCKLSISYRLYTRGLPDNCRANVFERFLVFWGMKFLTKLLFFVKTFPKFVFVEVFDETFHLRF